MRCIVQRVLQASVTVNNIIIGNINEGLLVLVGFEEADSKEDFEWMIKKIINLRIFNDQDQKMNLSLKDVSGEVLVVSQFTLYAQIKSGNRPSYSRASKPETAKEQYNLFVEELREKYNQKIETGIFGANMKVGLVNNGPVTIYLNSKDKN